jgi:hypothetical protein
MHGMPMVRSILDGTRRLSALGLFRLGSSVLRSAINLYRHDLISISGLHGALSAANLLERSAAALSFGRKRGRNHDQLK